MVPSMILLAIVLGIWLVYPAYSNGSTGVKDHYNQLNAERAKLASVQGKSGNANKLSSQLESMPADKDTLYEFVPVEMKESEIIDNLNKMAADSGLLIYGLSVSQPKMDVVEAPVTVSSTSLDPNSPTSDVPVATLPKEKSFAANMQISGSYAQMKSFFDKVDTFARYNSMATMFLKKGLSTAPGATGTATSSTTDTTALDVLTANLEIDFNVLDRATLSDGNITDSVFANSILDTKVISQIKSQYSNAALKLDVGQEGKANPFLP